MQGQLIEKDMNPTMIIHCKAGIGRSGTFLGCLFIMELMDYYQHQYGNFRHKKYEDQKVILSEQNMKLIKKKKVGISIFSLVRKMREDRWGMVQTPKQYFFLYDFCLFLYKHLDLIK